MMIATTQNPESKNRPTKLLDELHQLALERYGRPEPADRHVNWVKRYILFHQKRHPRDLEIRDVGA